MCLGEDFSTRTDILVIQLFIPWCPYLMAPQAPQHEAWFLDHAAGADLE